MPRQRCRHFVFSWAVITCIAFASLASAQTTGTIVGQVTDPANASVAGAEVEAVNIDTALSRQGATNSEGTYLIPSLPRGITRSR